MPERFKVIYHARRYTSALIFLHVLSTTCSSVSREILTAMGDTLRSVGEETGEDTT